MSLSPIRRSRILADALLFDLDGTLVDSIELLLRCMEFAFANHPPAPTRDAWTAGIGTPLREQIRSFGVDEHELETFVGRYRDYQDRHLEAMTHAYDGVPELLRWARTQGYRLAIVTSKGREMTARSLACVGLTDAFDAVVTAHDTERHKPDPAPVHEALRRLAIAPERALFVGDSTHDMHAGRAAGVATAAALWGPFTRDQLAPTSPTFWLDAMPDLRRLLESPAAILRPV